MAIDIRIAQTAVENLIRDTILYALGWRLPAVASVAALRAVTTQGASGTARTNDDLIAITGGPSVISYRWSATSTAADNGSSVIKPNDVTANGRWLQWTSPIYFALTPGNNSNTLDQFSTGYLRRVILLDNPMGEDDIMNLLGGAIPAVVIECHGDDPEDAEQITGDQWWTNYNLTITSISENLRDYRQAAQGSAVSGETTPGTNTIDGWIKALLAGTQLNQLLDGIRNVRIGHGENWRSDFGQRRVMRARDIAVMVTEEYPNSPNEIGDATDITAQAHMTALDQAGDAFDANNYLAAGCAVVPATGLTQPVTAGSAVIAGSTVTYAGQNQTFPAYSDTYRDLLPNGLMVFTSVTNNGAVPAVAATALRIGVTRTGASGVLTDQILAATSTLYGPQYDFPV